MSADSPDRFNLSSAEELIMLSDDTEVNVKRKGTLIRLHNLYADHALNWSSERRYSDDIGVSNYFRYELYIDVPIIMLPPSDNPGLDRMKLFEKMIGKLNILSAGYMPEVGRQNMLRAYDFKIGKKTYHYPYATFIRFFFLSPDRKELQKLKKKLSQFQGKIVELSKDSKTLYSLDRRGGKKYFRSLWLDYIKKHPRLGKEKKMPRKKSTSSRKKTTVSSGTTFKKAGQQLKKLKPRIKLSSKAYDTLAKRKLAIAKARLDKVEESMESMGIDIGKKKKKSGVFRKSAKKNSKSKMVHYSQEGGSYFKQVGKGRKTKITKAQFVKAIKQIDSVMGEMIISSDSKTGKQLSQEIMKILKKKIKSTPTKAGLQSTIAPLKSRQDRVSKVVEDASSFKQKVGKTKVPEKMKKTARNKATKLYVFPKRQAYPIGDLYHARAAVLRSMWPSNSKVRGKVLRAVVTAYPKYDWASYWNKERKEAKNSRTIKSFAQTIKMK